MLTVHVISGANEASSSVNSSTAPDVTLVSIPELVEAESQTDVPESDRIIDLQQYLVIVIRGRKVCAPYFILAR